MLHAKDSTMVLANLFQHQLVLFYFLLMVIVTITWVLMEFVY